MTEYEKFCAAPPGVDPMGPPSLIQPRMRLIVSGRNVGKSEFVRLVLAGEQRGISLSVEQGAPRGNRVAGRDKGVFLRGVHRSGGVAWVSTFGRGRFRFFDRLRWFATAPVVVAWEALLFAGAFAAAAAGDFARRKEGAR